MNQNIQSLIHSESFKFKSKVTGCTLAVNKVQEVATDVL